MTEAETEVAIQHHARNVDGNLHRFSVRWGGREPGWASTGARRLLAIDVYPEHPTAGCWTTLHVLTQATTTRQELLGLVNDALDEHLREHGAGPSTTVDVDQLLGMASPEETVTAKTATTSP